MAGYLPSSGAINLSQINSVFDGRGLNLNAYRGTTWFTSAGGSGTFSSGAIAFGDFYSKGPSSAAFSFTISSNQTNADLRTLAINAGWNQSSKVVATINSGVYISSNSTGTPALTVNGSFPGGVELINNGFIVGMGGAGGRGYGVGTGSVGSSGGLALSASSTVSIANNGTVGGGGGGGGGGQARRIVQVNKDGSVTYISSGGGGGGGRSSAAANSSGGLPGQGQNWPNGTSGGVGTVSTAGAGGNPTFNNTSFGGIGGAGGVWGASGASGGNGTAYILDSGPGAGGAGGAAVSGNSNITWLATGTRLGAIA